MLSEKIVELRKEKGISQDELANRLNVSRQAVSRWENATALPDAENILLLSRLFGVSADYLLNDEYKSDEDLPKVKELKQEAKNDSLRLIMIFLITLEVIALILQLIAEFVVQSELLTALSLIPFIAIIGGFEYAYHRKIQDEDEEAKSFRRRFYSVSVWFGAYMPIRLMIKAVLVLYPRPYSALTPEIIAIVIYMALAVITTKKFKK